MKFILDTNVCINFLRGKSQNIADRIVQIPIQNRIIPSVVQGELFHGAFKSSKPTENISKIKNFLKLFSSLPFDDSTSEIYGRIRVELEKKGNIIEPYDLQIAAIALANQGI